MNHHTRSPICLGFIFIVALLIAAFASPFILRESSANSWRAATANPFKPIM